MGTQRGACVDEIESEEIPFEIYLAQRFLRLYTDELTDISRKLDKGNELLGDIKTDTSALPEIKNVLNSYIGEQRKHNQWMKEHNQRLENILVKLAEK